MTLQVLWKQTKHMPEISSLRVGQSLRLSWWMKFILKNVMGIFSIIKFLVIVKRQVISFLILVNMVRQRWPVPCQLNLSKLDRKLRIWPQIDILDPKTMLNQRVILENSKDFIQGNIPDSQQRIDNFVYRDLAYKYSKEKLK